MGRSVRKCRGLGEAAVLEKTAARGKKRKFASGASDVSTSSLQLKTQRFGVVTPENSANSAYDSVSSGRVLTSCCSSNESSVDPEAEEEMTVEYIARSSDKSANCRDRHETTTPPREVLVQSSELESMGRARVELNSPQRPTVGEKPSEGKIEEFFATAEKSLQKEFIDKYNYDIVKDEPLEGRYEWIQLRP